MFYFILTAIAVVLAYCLGYKNGKTEGVKTPEDVAKLVLYLASQQAAELVLKGHAESVLQAVNFLKYQFVAAIRGEKIEPAIESEKTQMKQAA